MLSLESKKASSDLEEAFFYNNHTYVHPTAIIGQDVILEQGVKVGPFVTIVGKTIIAAGSRIYPHATVGFPAENIGTKTPLGEVIIGKNCEIREFVTIHSSKYERGQTRVGDNAYIMNYCHLSHDVILEENVILINNVQLGGHTYVEHHAYLTANSATHQSTRIGQYAALAPFSGIRQDIPPFCTFDGKPAGFAGLNIVGLRRAGFSSNALLALKRLTVLFFQKKIPLEKILPLLEEDMFVAQEKVIHDFLTFVQQSQRGVSRRTTIDTSIL